MKSKDFSEKNKRTEMVRLNSGGRGGIRTLDPN